MELKYNSTLTISCIIPTYNRSKVLCNTISMLLEQSFALDEIIIVDQSKVFDDNSYAQLHSWQKRSKIIWIHQSEVNASLARNKGAIFATSEILLFLDDDIIINSNFIAAHAVNYKNSDVDAISGQILDDRSKVVYKRRFKSKYPELDWLYFPKNYGYRCKTSWMASGNFSIRRVIYFDVGGMDKTYCKGAFREESDFAMRLLRKGYIFIFDPNASVYHLGISNVLSGGSRPTNNCFGMWHHIFGSWYFIFGFAKLYSILPLICLSVRGFILNRETLKHPARFGSRLILWIGAIPIAVIIRLKHKIFGMNKLSFPSNILI